MSKRSFIDSVEVKTPCSESWDEMTGNEQVRFCSHCSKHVNDLSAITRKEAMRMVRASDGNICIRYRQHPVTKRPLFADGLIQIARRTPRLTAGVMAASLTVATVRAQEEKLKVEPSPSPTVEIAQVVAVAEVVATPESTPSPTPVTGGKVTGTVTDAHSAVVPGITVTMVSADGKFGFKGSTNEQGLYNTERIPAGNYTVSFTHPGFATTVRAVEVYDCQEPRVDVQMEVGQLIALGGAMVSIEYRNPLSQAVADDDIEEARDLLAKGENVNGKDQNYDNITPLFIAVENGNVEMVRLLLDFGAKVNVRNKEKQTPLMYIDDDATPELIATLLNAGAKVNVVDKEGNTPLILAASEEVDVEVIKALLAAGADVKAANKAGRTALLEAANNDKIELVRALITAGSDVNAKDKEGKNAWDLTSDDEVEELLVACGTEAHPKLEEEYQKWGDPQGIIAIPSPTPPIN